MNDPSIALGYHQGVSFIVLGIALVMGVLILVLPRQRALLPIILISCFLPISEKLVIGGLNFSMLRLVVAFGWIRLMLHGELGQIRWLKLDRVFLLWAAVRVLAFTLLWQNTAALVNGLGYAFDEIGMYILFRALVRDTDDFKRIIRWFALAFIPLAILMCLEKVTARDPFYVLGGVPEFSTIRDGIVRAQGPFGHPILAGTFGAVCVPLFWALWVQGKRDRLIAGCGFVFAALITFASGSSGPIGSYAAGIFGIWLWRMRDRLRQLRWALVGLICVLQLVMKDPVWFIFARVDVLSGSTGWHRSYLIDRTVAHFGDWWLCGAKDISEWGVWAGDTTNQFITEGIRGGFFTMLLFIWIVVIAFSYSGSVLKAVRQEPRRLQLMLWGVGVALFSHVVSFMGVAYFDQNVVNWYLVLAMVAAAYQVYVGRKSSPLGNEVSETEDQRVVYETAEKSTSAAQLIHSLN